MQAGVDEGGGDGAPPLPPRSCQSGDVNVRPADKRNEDKTRPKADISFDNRSAKDKTTSTGPTATPPSHPPDEISGAAVLRLKLVTFCLLFDSSGFWLTFVC